MNRALRAATVGVLLLTPVALTACGAGQVDQTSSQVRDKTGPSAKIGDLYLRQVQLAPPLSGGAYAPGDDAELTMSITNSGDSDDALVAVRGEGFSGVRVTGTGVSATSSGTSAAATSTAAATSSTPGASTRSGTGTATATATGTATGTTAGTASAAPTSAPATSSAPSSTVNIPLPAHQTVFLGQNSPTVTIVGLQQSLTSAQLLKMTFTFRRAGDITLDVVVAAPETGSRDTTFDFSEEPSPVFGGQTG